MDWVLGSRIICQELNWVIEVLEKEEEMDKEMEGATKTWVVEEEEEVEEVEEVEEEVEEVEETVVVEEDGEDEGVDFTLLI